MNILNPKYRRHPIMFIFQFIFSCTGWFLSYEIWRFFHPKTEAETEVDLDKLFNFAFGDQGAFNNVGIGLGYVSTYTPTAEAINII